MGMSPTRMLHVQAWGYFSPDAQWRKMEMDITEILDYADIDELARRVFSALQATYPEARARDGVSATEGIAVVVQ